MTVGAYLCIHLLFGQGVLISLIILGISGRSISLNPLSLAFFFLGSYRFIETLSWCNVLWKLVLRWQKSLCTRYRVFHTAGLLTPSKRCCLGSQLCSYPWFNNMPELVVKRKTAEPDACWVRSPLPWTSVLWLRPNYWPCCIWISCKEVLTSEGWFKPWLSQCK